VSGKLQLQTLPGDTIGWDRWMKDHLAEHGYRGQIEGYSLSRWRDYPPLHTFFPLVFAGGGRWNELSFACGDCRGPEYHGDEIRGHVAYMGVDAFFVDAALLCPTCNKLTFSVMLLPSNMDFCRLEQNADGTHSLAVYGKRSWWRRALHWLRQRRAKQDLPRE